MAKLLKTSEMAARLGATKDDLSRWKKKGAPCTPRYFPCAHGGPRTGGWDPDKLLAWLRKEGRLDDDGNLIHRKPGRQDAGKGFAKANKKARRVEATKNLAVEVETVGVLTSKAMAEMLGISKGPLVAWKSEGAPCLPKFFTPSGTQGGGVRGTGWKPDELRAWLKKEGRMDENGVLVAGYSGSKPATLKQAAVSKEAKSSAKRRTVAQLAAETAARKAKSGLLTTQELADLLNVTTARLHRWASQCGAPHIKHHFPPVKLPGATSSGGQWGNAWYPDKVIAWLKKEGRMDENGVLVEQPREQEAHGDPGRPGADLELSARIVPVALPHLLGAFAHACQGGGIPAGLQIKLAKAGLEELRPEALRMIEDMAMKHSRTEMQWVLIREALPALMGKRRNKRKGVPNNE